MPTFNPNNALMQDSVNGKVPTEQGTLVLKEFMTQSAVTKLAKYEEMTKPEKEFTYLASGPGAYWVGEGDRIQTSKAQWLTAKMISKKLGVIIPVSKEFLRYSVTDFFTQMRPAIAEAFAIKFDQAALFGVDSPFGKGVSVFEKIKESGNTIALNSLGNLYDELNGVMALVEDADKDVNGFTTTRRFRQKLRGTKDGNGLPIFNDATGGTTQQALGLPIGYVDSKSWDYEKAALLAADWNYTRYGIPQGMEYKISEDATLTTIVDADGNPINLYERDMVALRVTQQVGFMTLTDDAFAAITPATEA
ncbi:phage major capsid protein [Bacillus velezensis]|uniref:phage major capsid protein n=1 Tax=Bacillus amyloliquefaciens group TaxID=1938374 RepID=UPI0013752B90|nr:MULTISPECIES: phage major capsid protein [Bacillus amyloliquefaciens group]MCT6829406.1 phage major capsid protein [Bacillus velezensis]MCT6864733.1 phage major capsid protein [Bacillus velezensis]NRS34086.1 phage major capsid protein [Bacillus velezensis]NRS44610.1 phage major capsid protein [Bacillus velezensis]QOX74645.1 phage major capsid protein [Bacillus velezensis]